MTLTKTFRHPVTLQNVVVSHTANDTFIEVVSETRIEKYHETSIEKTILRIEVRTSSIDAICFQRFNKDFAKEFVNRPDSFRSFLISHLKHVL